MKKLTILLFLLAFGGSCKAKELRKVPDPAKGEYFIVEEDMDFFDISKEVYGHMKYWNLLYRYEHNEHIPSLDVKKGTIVYIPKLRDKRLVPYMKDFRKQLKKHHPVLYKHVRHKFKKIALIYGNPTTKGEPNTIGTCNRVSLVIIIHHKLRSNYCAEHTTHHELGHCILNLDHKEKTLMAPSTYEGTCEEPARFLKETMKNLIKFPILDDKKKKKKDAKDK